MMTYSSLFKCKRVPSILLQDSNILNELIAEGYYHIKKYNFTSFHEITRFPTVGCIVELYTIPNVGTFPINSDKAKKLINKLCYF